MAMDKVGEVTFPPSFANPCTEYADGEIIYAASLQSDRRKVRIKKSPGDVVVAEHDFSDDTAQSISLFPKGGTLHLDVTSVGGPGRVQRFYNSRIALTVPAPPPPPAPAPVPPNTAIGMIRYHLESIEELVRTLEG